MKYSVLAAIAAALPSMVQGYSASSGGVIYPSSFHYSNSSSTAGYSSSNVIVDVTTDVTTTLDTTTTVDTTITETDLSTTYSSTGYTTITRDHRSSAAASSSPYSFLNTTASDDEPTTYITEDETPTDTATDNVEATSLQFSTTTRVYTDCNYEGVCSTITTESLVASFSENLSGTPTEVTTYEPIPSSSAPVSSTAAPGSSGSAVSSPSSTSATTSSSSSSTPSSSLAPYISGVNNDGQPLWFVYVPSGLGPWESVSFTADLDTANFKYDCSAFTYEVDGKAVSSDDYTVSCSSTSFDIDYSEALSSGTLKVGIYASKDSDKETKFTNTVTVGVTKGSASRIKRAIETWVLSATVEISASSSASASASASGIVDVPTADSSTSASTTSTSVDYDATTTVFYVPSASATDDDASVSTKTTTSTGPNTSVASTLTTIESSNTYVYITITSCSAGSCTASKSKALETVVTTTISGTETSYTTYCPLSGETTAQTSTKTSSSSKAKETETPASQLTVVTTTISGVETSYTTYCPLTGTETSSTKATMVTTTLSGSSKATVIPLNELTTVPVVSATTVGDIIPESTSAAVTTVHSSSATSNSSLPVPSVLQGAANAISKNVYANVAGILVAAIMMI